MDSQQAFDRKCTKQQRWNRQDNYSSQPRSRDSSRRQEGPPHRPGPSRKRDDRSRVREGTLGSTIYNVLAQTRKIQETILGTKFDNLSLLPSNLDLASAEVELSSTPGREYILREALAPIKQDYDNIIIDCPPNIGLLTLNALVTSDLVLIPVQCEFYPMEGLPTLVKVMDLVKSRLKAQFDFRIVLTMYDARTALSRRVQSQVWNNFGERALKTVIPRSVRMAEAPSKGLPGVIYRPKNPASERYKALTKELFRVALVAEA